MESESIDPSLISITPSLFTDAHHISDFNLLEARPEETIQIPCQGFSRDDNGNLRFCFCPRCEKEDLGIPENTELPSLIANNDIAIEPRDTEFGSSQLEANTICWPGLAESQSLSIGTYGEQAVKPKKQRSSRPRSNRVSKPYRTTKKAKARSNDIHPTVIVARLQQSLQIDPSCSPKFKSECSKLLEQVKGLMYVEMGRPKSKNSLNVSYMQDIISVGSSESSQGSVSRLANDIFSIAGGSDSAPESSPSSNSRSQQSQGNAENSSSVYSRAQKSQNRASLLYQCTYRACTSSFASKTDWKRHEGSEKHWLQQKYMCLECDTSAIDSTGMLECLYCSGSAEELGDIRTHNLQCDPARKLGRTFTRKDHFRNHLRSDHSMPLTPAASTWVYEMESEWPRQCGFCGIIVDTWAQRANHIEDHFRRGYRIFSWKLPFPRIPDPKGKGPRIDSDDGSTNSSTSSFSNDSVFSAKDRCAVGGVARHGTVAKDKPQNRGLSGNQGEFRNAKKMLAYRGASVLSSKSSRNCSRKSVFCHEPWPEDWKMFEREHFHRVADDDRKYITSMVSRSGKTLVVDHRKRIYDECAPVSVSATTQQHNKNKHPNGLSKPKFISRQREMENPDIQTSGTQKRDKRRHELSRAIPIALRSEKEIFDARMPTIQEHALSADYNTISSSVIGISDIDMVSIAEKDKHARSWRTSKAATLKTPQRLAADSYENYAIYRYLSDREAPNSLAYLLEQNLMLTELINRPTSIYRPICRSGISDTSENDLAMPKPNPEFLEVNHLKIDSRLEPSGTRKVPDTVSKSPPFDSSRSLTNASIKPCPKGQATYPNTSTESGSSKPGYESSGTEVAEVKRSWRSVSTNSRRQSNGSHPSRTSSISSAPSLIPPWHDDPVNSHHNYEYTLPCEFSFAGCHLQFHPEMFEAWIAHSTSHFGWGHPPLRTVCTFCDENFFEADGINSWRRRMIHIGGHFYDLRRAGLDVHHPRPDFHLIDHLKRVRRIGPEDYSTAIQYTEQPYCKGLFPLDYKTPEMVWKDERSLRVPYDLEMEARQRRKELRQRSSNSERGEASQILHSTPLTRKETINGKSAGVAS